ncbi:MAG: hypothetical protein J6U08_02345 [Paludibacteraceae bacterium]|nr:hypothetical protein [Paludibacteraceae bacterium]
MDAWLNDKVCRCGTRLENVREERQPDAGDESSDEPPHEGQVRDDEQGQDLYAQLVHGEVPEP